MEKQIPLNFEKNQELPKWIVVLMKAYEEYLKEQENKLEVRNGKSK